MTELKNVAEKRQKKKKKSRLQRKIGSPIYIYIYIIIFKTPKVGILNFPQLFFSSKTVYNRNYKSRLCIYKTFFCNRVAE